MIRVFFKVHDYRIDGWLATERRKMKKTWHSTWDFV
jgi:hypothetical protein